MGLLIPALVVYAANQQPQEERKLTDGGGTCNIRNEETHRERRDDVDHPADSRNDQQHAQDARHKRRLRNQQAGESAPQSEENQISIEGVSIQAQKNVG